jgi:hypothetical protein
MRWQTKQAAKEEAVKVIASLLPGSAGRLGERRSSLMPYPPRSGKVMAKFIAALLASLLFLACGSASATLFPNRKGKTFQTRGTAVIMKDSRVSGSRSGTLGVEEIGILIPAFIDVETSARWDGLAHDAEKGWTKCRVPIKDDASITGGPKRALVFDCRPQTYYKQGVR